jgi:hypothetical protein
MVSFPDLAPRTPEFYASVLSGGSHAVLLLYEVVKKCSDVIKVLAAPPIARGLLEIAASPDQRPFVSLRALEMVAKVSQHSDVQESLREFERVFDSVVDLSDCRLAVLLSLFPKRIAWHVDDFLASRTPTVYDAALVSVLRRIDPGEFVALVERAGLLSAATAALGHSKVNGQIAAFLRVINDRKALSASLQTAEWAEFVDSTLFPHLRQANESYGGPYVQATQAAKVPFSPSSESLEVALVEGEKLSSSSGSASDDESCGGRARRRSSVTAVPGFDFVANAQNCRSLEPINVSELPTLNALGGISERRARRRNAGSVTIADLPKAFGP